MAHQWQFVDSIAASPTVRLDINSLGNGIFMTEQPELSPPTLRRVTSSSMMADGERIAADAYNNRILRLPLRIMRATSDLQATLLQSLSRELTRPEGNIVRVNMGNTLPMFFRVLSSPDMVYEMAMRMPMHGTVTMELQCEPFGYGLEEAITGVAVSNNPAAANGMFMDITSPKGDVETPLYVTCSNSVIATGRRVSAFSVRRRGTPSATPLVLQAEAMTQGTDTTIQANNALFSGAGSNFSKTAFVTSPTTMNQRLSLAKWPTSASVDARGTYRVFIRVRQNTTTDVHAMRLVWGGTDLPVTNDTVTLPVDTGPSAPTLKLIDLGLIQIPVGYDPTNRGFSNVEIATEGVTLSVQSQRVSGSGSLDYDYMLFLPSDDRGITMVEWPNNASVTDFVLEGAPSPAVYGRNASGQITSTEIVEVMGTGLMITPGRTNRLFFARDVGTGTATLGGGDTFATTTTLTPFYFPRYLFPLRPATT